MAAVGRSRSQAALRWWWRGRPVFTDGMQGVTRYIVCGNRRIRGDLIELFKIYKGIDKLDFAKLFTINSNPTRGHGCKLVKKFAKTSLRQSFFTNRVIDIWNDLPPRAINSSSLNEFKHTIDSYFLERG